MRNAELELKNMELAKENQDDNSTIEDADEPLGQNTTNGFSCPKAESNSQIPNNDQFLPSGLQGLGGPLYIIANGPVVLDPTGRVYAIYLF